METLIIWILALIGFGLFVYFVPYRNINGLDFKVSSNYSLMSEIPDYGANIKISNTF